MNKLIVFIKKDIHIIIFSLMAGFLITLALSAGAYAKRVSSEISDSVVRFHVLANSDEEFDQNLKLKVRDDILEHIGGGLKQCKSREDAEKYLEEHLEEIKKTAEKTIKAAGYCYSVKAELSYEHYPLRYYDNAVFPEGDYESLRVIIGRGEGHNWWCVMYPPLCLNGGSVEYADTELLKEILTEDGYDVVVLSSEGNVPEIKFKIVEWWTSMHD
ncbi:hypothetical protein IMSAG049_00034 [Clostridiales bacterium]|nr:hypothetical protein IMSAG049_00034 [Clostridiales bacterium]